MFTIALYNDRLRHPWILPHGAIEPFKKDGKFYEATKSEAEKDGAFNDYGKPKQHNYTSLGQLLSNVKLEVMHKNIHACWKKVLEVLVSV